VRPGVRTLAAKCGCASTAKQTAPDPELRRAIAQCERRQAEIECRKERHGALALDAAECGTRWMSGGRQQVPPSVKYYDPDGRTNGYYDPRHPDSIFISHGLSAEQTVKTVMHELHHWRTPWMKGHEEMANLVSRLYSKQYFESSHWNTRASA